MDFPNYAFSAEGWLVGWLVGRLVGWLVGTATPGAATHAGQCIGGRPALIREAFWFQARKHMASLP